MTGADGGQLRDVTRWAASFMARLFTGAAAPAAELPAEEVALSGGGCSSLYRSVSTEEDGAELDGDESSEEQLLAADEGEDPCRTRSVCERSLIISHGVVHTMMGKAHELRRRHSTGAAAPRSGDAAAAESEPLVLRRRAGKRANDVVETIEHPFGCGRRGREESSVLLLSS